MSRRAERSQASATVAKRHGKAGEHRLSVSVEAWLKDALIDIAEARGLPVKAVVVAALQEYVTQEIREAA